MIMMIRWIFKSHIKSKVNKKSINFSSFFLRPKTTFLCKAIDLDTLTLEEESLNVM